MVDAMKTASAQRLATSVQPCHSSSPMPSGAVLLAIELGEEARGITGLDVLSRILATLAIRN